MDSDSDSETPGAETLGAAVIAPGATLTTARSLIEEEFLPRPTVLIGTSTTLWDNVKRDVCPSCGNRRLRTYEYCLRCDAWGLGHLLVDRKIVDVYVRQFSQKAAGLRLGVPVRLRGTS